MTDKEYQELANNVEFLITFARNQVKVNETLNKRIKVLDDRAIYYSGNAEYEAL